MIVDHETFSVRLFLRVVCFAGFGRLLEAFSF